jgi:hypothetical protein
MGEGESGDGVGTRRGLEEKAWHLSQAIEPQKRAAQHAVAVIKRFSAQAA